jgi:hypothetical protein
VAAVAAVLLITTVLASTLGRRVSAPLAAAAALVAVMTGQLGVLLSADPDASVTVGVLALAALLCGLVPAGMAAARLRGHHHDPVEPVPQD